MSYGYNQVILRINLTDGLITRENITEEFCRCYLGGAGFVTYYLLKELNSRIDPLSPENKLIFALGPATGTSLSGASRNSIGTKSPLTGGIVLSEVGEHWGSELKHAGYDLIIVEGKADKPVYLWIKDDKVEIRDASKIWGKTTKDTLFFIREEHKDQDIKCAAIGPAGEKLVKFACIMNGLYNAAGRGGAGAVMGSKNLKAIAVRGSIKPQIARPEEVKSLIKWFAQNVPNLPVAPVIREYGTGASYEANVLLGNVPINNFLDGEFPEAVNLDAGTIKDSIRIGMRRCGSCVLACKKVVAVEEPYQVDPDYGGPEYETLAALGSNCGISDLKAVCKGNEMCNAFSLDTISTGCVIAFAMECFENGLINTKDTGGIELRFGNAEAMLEMIKLIAKREGIGELLAEGTSLAAKSIGSEAEHYAINVKGLEIPMHEPRLKPGLGLGYMVNPHGADHCCNLQDTLFAGGPMLLDYEPLGFGKPISKEDIGPRKIALFRTEQMIRIVRDCMIMCWFCTWSPLQLSEIINAITGWNTSIAELLRIAERVLAMTRMFNYREGFTCDDDVLPSRFFKPKTGGALSETALDRATMDEAKKYYYMLMGWDVKNGRPLDKKLEELGLDWVIQ